MGYKSCGAAALALLLTACGAPTSRPSKPPGPTLPAQPPPSVSSNAYRIDPVHSELRILVYRAGPMAALGHDHVIVNRALGGWLQYAGVAGAASFSLTVPAADFVVDDAQARRDEGAEFAEEIPDDAKSGTLHNMLSAAVLDAAQFPAITLRSVAVRGARGELEATVALNVAGHESTLLVPFAVDSSPGRLIASGALAVRQSAIGLAPFSVFLGALRVQDEMRVKFKLVAVAT
jgi:polyisoprenoid-binding protein YceI